MTSRKSASSSPHEAVLSFEYATERSAALVERSIRPEEDDIDGDRTSATVSRDGVRIDVVVDAADLVALRAGVNTWCSLVAVAEAAGDAALA